MVFNGEFVPGNQWVSPENPYYQKDFPVPKRDVAKAKALLKEAGITAPFDVDFMVPKGAETQAVAEVIQAMAAEIGINMKIRVTEFATSLKQAEQGDYQAYSAGMEWAHRPGRQHLYFHKCNAPQDYPGYCNPEVDKLLDEARVPTDFADAQGDLREAHQNHPRRRPEHLSLSPPNSDRAYGRNCTATSSCPTGSCAWSA